MPKEAAILNKSVSIAVQLQQQLNLSSSRHRKKNEPQVSRCYCDTKSTTSLRQVRKHATRLFSLSSQTVTHLSLEERSTGHVKCLGKLLCGHFPPVETIKVLEVVGQVQLLLTGTGWLSLVNSRLANRANKQAAEKRANLSHLAGNLKPNLINGFINLVQVLLRKPCATAKAE